MLQSKWLRTAALALALGATGPVAAQTEIDLFFPVPVDGALAKNMSELVKGFNETHSDIKATPVFTGSYDETLIKTRAASKAGKPPSVVIMSANFLTDLAIEKEIQPLDDLIAADKMTNASFMGQFFPALLGNAVIDTHVYGAPFQNSTPLLYYNADHFKAAGLDPDKPPQTWQELLDAAKKLTVREGDRVTRWGVMLPSNYDYGGWVLEAMTMSNGGRYYNEEYGGEVYYDTPSMLGALTFWSDLANKHKVHPTGETKAPAITTAFLGGQASMMILSTGSLTFVRSNAKFPFKVAFVPRNVRNAVPDWRRLARAARGSGRSKAQSWLDPHQISDEPGKVGLVEPCNWLLRAEHGRIRHAGHEGVSGQKPRGRNCHQAARLCETVVRHI